MSVFIKHCGKGRNCLYKQEAISPFPTMFSKGFFPRPVKRYRLDQTKFKSFADDKFGVDQKLIVVLENIVGKGENVFPPRWFQI